MLAFCLLRRRCGGLIKHGALSEFKSSALNGSRSAGTGGRSPGDAGERSSSIVGPSPSATIIKAAESLSFTVDGDPHATAGDSAVSAGPMELLSTLSQVGGPMSGGGEDGRAPWPLSGDVGGHSVASTLAASAAPRSVGGPMPGVGGGLGSMDGASSSIASFRAPKSADYGGGGGGGGIGADELKIFDVLYRSRDSAVYQGACHPHPQPTPFDEHSSRGC